MQDHYNLVYREEEREMIPLCIDQGVGVIPWSPLARGFLAGNRTKEKGGATTRSKSDEYAHGMYYQDDDFAVVERLKAVAGQLGCTMPQAALAWMLVETGSHRARSSGRASPSTSTRPSTPLASV